MGVTDKILIRTYYGKALDSLEDAFDNLTRAYKILESDLLINGNGFYTEKINKEKRRIDSSIIDIKEIILPAIWDL